MSNLHILHIGKTGGTAVKHALRDHTNTGAYNILLHRHNTRIEDVPVGEKMVFFLRDPISRFSSGFYSRKRNGRPRYNLAWTAEERKAFAVFETPNELALALSDLSSPYYENAIHAMQNIEHINSYNNWYGTMEYVETRTKDFLYVGFQERLSEDFSRLISQLGLPNDIQLPQDDRSAHKNPADLDRTIEEEGIDALNNWYQDDRSFYDYCRMLMDERGSESL